jgi:hypothetical protein
VSLDALGPPGGTLDPARLVGRVIGPDQAGAALAAMDGRASAAGMTVVEI